MFEFESKHFPDSLSGKISEAHKFHFIDKLLIIKKHERNLNIKASKRTANANKVKR